MKKMNLTNLLIVSTAILFTACSTKEAPKKETKSLESVVALQQARIASEQERIISEQERIASLPLAQTFPIVKEELAQTYPIVEEVEEIELEPVVMTATYTPPPTYTPPRRYQRVYSHARVNPYSIIKKIEWDAKKLLGKKYVWGATGPYSYDCSGFT